jgi:ankyrin repeat protein
LNFEKNTNGDSLIHVAAKNHHKNGCLSVIIEELSQSSFELLKMINKPNYYGNTALMDAVLMGQFPTV